MHLRRLVVFALVAASLVAVSPPTGAEEPGSISPVAQDRSVEAVVLQGSQFPEWSAGPEIIAREPVHSDMNSDCESDATGNHNCSQASRVSNPREGVSVDRFVGYRWDATVGKFVEIPFQVDERFTRYISNLASNCNAAGAFCVGWGAYSGADPQLSYVYDREGYRFTENAPDDPCRAIMKPGDGPEADPTKGLDDNDEFAFLYRDTGTQAPATARLPRGVQEMRAVTIADPSAPDAAPRHAYIALASEVEGARRSYTASNGYIRYERDAKADLYESTSSNYGNAPRGPHCNEQRQVIGNGPRRPRDTGWVMTPRYAVRYDGRWLLRGFQIADGHADEPLASPSEYGPPLVDQWKARAYQQKPGDSTPCCGFQTEQDDWGGTSVLLGEKAGPVRVIRAVWGSNSGTNTVKQEIFYPDVIIQQSYLRVHPIPPLGGIFSYWDHAAGVVTKYYNAQLPDGVDIDGKNDEEVFGTFYANPAAGEIRHNGEPLVPPAGTGCFQYCADLDVTDPTLNATGIVGWEQVSGASGGMVFSSSFEQVTPGAAQAFAAIPYYRDDSCFDDGTGLNPGPHLLPKKVDNPQRPCWDADTDETPTGDLAHDLKWRQGLIGGHGVQVLIVPETDNALTTLPVTELDSRTRIVMLPGDQGNVGARYGNADDFPLRTAVTEFEGAPPKVDTTLEFTDSSDTTAPWGEAARFEARLADPSGPVGNADLTFAFQGETYDAVTNAEGVASTDAVVKRPPGDHAATVDFAGDDSRESSSDETSFTAGKRESAIDFTAVRKGRKNIVVSAKLTDGGTEEGLGGRELRVFVDDELRGTAETGEDGTAVAKFSERSPKGKTFRVEFAGDDDYAASSAEAVFGKRGATG